MEVSSTNTSAFLEDTTLSVGSTSLIIFGTARLYAGKSAIQILDSQTAGEVLLPWPAKGLE